MSEQRGGVRAAAARTAGYLLVGIAYAVWAGLGAVGAVRRAPNVTAIAGIVTGIGGTTSGTPGE